MSKFASLVRFDVEKFDGRINFGLRQVHVKDVLIQSGLHKALNGNQGLVYPKVLMGPTKILTSLA